MFPTFTGDSRRRRPVNLSGRNSNPFAQTGGPSQSSQNAVANALQTRVERQQERERSQAAVRLQRTWRGHCSRKRLKRDQRVHWDEIEKGVANTTFGVAISSYGSEQQTLEQLDLLLRFYDYRDPTDYNRMQHFYQRFLETNRVLHIPDKQGSWSKAITRWEFVSLTALEKTTNVDQIRTLFDVLRTLVWKAPQATTRNSYKYYQVLKACSKSILLPVDLLLGPLQSISPPTILAYEGFAAHILTVPHLGQILENGQEGFTSLSGGLNCKILATGVADALRDEKLFQRSARTKLDKEHRLWFLAYVIFFHRHAHQFQSLERYASGEDFIYVVTTLLSDLTDFVKEDSTNTIDDFVSEQLDSLVSQETVGNLLSKIGPETTGNAQDPDQRQEQDARSRVLANYILTLLRLYPQRADEIRMWLYLGTDDRVPMIKYFWNATRCTPIFEQISKEPWAAVDLLKANGTNKQTSNRLSDKAVYPIGDQWRVILIFVELYMFVLKVMDDEEFFSGGKESTKTSNANNKGRRNSLILTDVQNLVTFLKHLGFTMYYSASDILELSESDRPKDVASLFKMGNTQVIADKDEPTTATTNIARIQGMSLDYLKGLVTGLLRAIYERDSRRPFMPKGHWLLTSRFDMTNFIDDVVEEEERRHKIQADDDEDNNQDESDEGESNSSHRLIGTGRVQRLQRTEQLKRQARKASRKRYLQAVAPRLEILQNMPFLIPFTTRVKIFRRFVQLDQLKRRSGLDPETWRLAMMSDPEGGGNRASRHHAKIRRDHEFEDAYEQFYDLGSGLKEPINISFMDQWDQPEAGIDGGGVTKEFLTSVSNQAFKSSGSTPLFAENEQHFLFPNPSSIETQKALLREFGYEDDSQPFRAKIIDLLQQYEFLGRIIGKCLYEGILVDIGFAGFFLLKWALTGGGGSAPLESGYRANLNDLREFDEGLYQGLLQLKNYSGDVEDFSLNFSVTDTIPLPSTPADADRSKTITRDLRPNGSNIPVTNANRLVYISSIARHRLSSQPYLQTSAFLRGLSSMILPSWMSMFNQVELQTLVGGAPQPIDVSDLRRNTAYGGVYTIGDDGQEHPSVKIFWDVFEDFEDADRRKLLKFVTSTPRAPLLGFASLHPRFSIRDSSNDETRLPSTSTCVNLLKLPRYNSVAICRQKVLQAVNSGAGFDLS